MWRHLWAVLLVVVLVCAATLFLGISVVAGNHPAFDASDILSCATFMWFALFGGLIARQYRFALSVGVLYLCLWGLAIHFLGAHTQAGVLPLVGVNAPNIAASVLSGMLGACVGVFVRTGQRRVEASAAQG